MDCQCRNTGQHRCKVYERYSYGNLLNLTIHSAQSHDLRTALAGHIARALSVFCVDEVVIFNDGTTTPPKHALDHTTEYTGAADPDHFLVHLLAYLETPPHLRKLLFPMHPDLRTAGSLHSLDLPHHLKPDEWCPYREGVTIDDDSMVVSDITQVQTGLRIPVTISTDIPPNTRVTVRFDEGTEAESKNPSVRKLTAQAVPPALPREESGYYWGYVVRKADSLSAVFEECTFAGGYDFSIGTSERGIPLERLYEEGESQAPTHFNHLLILLGGVAGLEVAVKNDKALQKLGVTQAKDMFDRWVNVCPNQGSRTIRTEEAVWLSLMGLRRLVEMNWS